MIKLAIITPAYNASKWITDLHSSIKTNLKLSSKIYEGNFEWIVVNDGSTDNTEEVVKSFKEPWVKLVNQENQGLGGARTTGLYASSAEWVWHIDSDDFITNDAFTKIEDLIADNKLDLIKVADNHYDDQKKIIKPEPLYSYSKMKRKPHAWPQGLLIRRSIIPNDFKYFPKNGDVANWFIFDSLDWNRFKILNERIVNYRVNMTTSMSTNRNADLTLRAATYCSEIATIAKTKNIQKWARTNCRNDLAYAIIIAKAKNQKIEYDEIMNALNAFDKMVIYLSKATPSWISKLIIK